MKEVEIEWYYVTCPICGRRIYGITELGAKNRVIQHLKEVHQS